MAEGENWTGVRKEVWEIVGVAKYVTKQLLWIICVRAKLR